MNQPLQFPGGNGHVPLLGQRTKTWYCGRGHEQTIPEGAGPFRMQLPFGVNERGEPQVLGSGPVCPVCFLEWVSLTFPSSEEKPDA